MTPRHIPSCAQRSQPRFRDSLADLDEPTELSGHAERTAAGPRVDAAVAQVHASAPEIRAMTGAMPRPDLPLDRYLVAALARADSTVAVSKDGATTSFVRGRRIAWLETWSNGTRLVANVPIERTPQLAGHLVFEIPVSADDLPAISSTIEGVDEAAGAVAMVVAAVAIERGWDLSEPEVQAAYRRGIMWPDAPELRFGSGQWPPAPFSARSLSDTWGFIVTDLRTRAGWAARATVRSPGRLSVQVVAGIKVSARFDASSVYVAAEVDDVGRPGRVDRLIARRDELRKALGTEQSWQRRVGSVLVLLRVGPLADHTPSETESKYLTREMVRMGDEIVKVIGA